MVIELLLTTLSSFDSDIFIVSNFFELSDVSHRLFERRKSIRSHFRVQSQPQTSIKDFFNIVTNKYAACTLLPYCSLL